jgi:hypothetical protein
VSVCLSACLSVSVCLSFSLQQCSYVEAKRLRTDHGLTHPPLPTHPLIQKVDASLTRKCNPLTQSFADMDAILRHAVRAADVHRRRLLYSPFVFGAFRCTALCCFFHAPQIVTLRSACFILGFAPSPVTFRSFFATFPSFFFFCSRFPPFFPFFLPLHSSSLPSS